MYIYDFCNLTISIYGGKHLQALFRYEEYNFFNFYNKLSCALLLIHIHTHAREMHCVCLTTSQFAVISRHFTSEIAIINEALMRE